MGTRTDDPSNQKAERRGSRVTENKKSGQARDTSARDSSAGCADGVTQHLHPSGKVMTPFDSVSTSWLPSPVYRATIAGQLPWKGAAVLAAQTVAASRAVAPNSRCVAARASCRVAGPRVRAGARRDVPA